LLQPLPLLASILCFLLALNPLFAQSKQAIRGKVVDDRNQPLISLTVVVKNSTTGTTTNAEGDYTITAAPSDVLVFSYIGYQAKEVPVGSQTTINVTMATDAKSLDEVVVVGYSSRSQSELVSSVSVVSGEKLRDVTSNNTATMLQGKASGVVVS